jgi:hypothetical protein
MRDTHGLTSERRRGRGFRPGAAIVEKDPIARRDTRGRDALRAPRRAEAQSADGATRIVTADLRGRSSTLAYMKESP